MGHCCLGPSKLLKNPKVEPFINIEKDMSLRYKQLTLSCAFARPSFVVKAKSSWNQQISQAHTCVTWGQF